MTNDTNQPTADNPDLTETFKELLKNSDVTGIEDVIKQLNTMADVKRKAEYSVVYGEFQERVVALGFATVQDFIVAIEAQGIIKPSRTQRRKVKIRYRDPDNTKDTWTGRGKQPNWLQAHIANGRSIEEFEVKDSEESEPETESQAKA